ncbi:MAG: PorT family protein [Bacteroidetes bacterium]|nr:MAG: PorT family protein [Bacteroidota bacterium]
MKKLFALLLPILLFSLLPAQNLGGGLILGFNASQVDGDAVGGFRQFGLSGGGFVTYRIHEQMHLQPEILYDQLGSRDRGGFFSLRTTHISIPVLFAYTLPVDLGSGYQDLILEAGPVVGVLLAARDNNSGANYTSTYTNPDFRAVVGGEYRFSDRWAFHMRWGYSIVSFLRSGSRPIYLSINAPGLYHHYVQFSLRRYLSRR